MLVPPICIYTTPAKSRVDRTFGQVIRVLVDTDLTQPLNFNVLVEREGFTFFVDKEYKKISKFCAHCRKVGHGVRKYKSLHKDHPQSTFVQKAKPSSKIVDVAKDSIGYEQKVNLDAEIEQVTHS